MNPGSDWRAGNFRIFLGATCNWLEEDRVIKLMPPVYSYSEAVHYATERVLATSAAMSRKARAEQLKELLYDLATSIPNVWGTASRNELLTRQPIERILTSLVQDMSNDLDGFRYQVLSSIFQLALVVKQTGC